MPAVSISQQRLMALVLRCKKTGECASDAVAKLSKKISKKEAKKFARTSHAGLPNRVTESKLTFKEFLSDK